MNINWWEAAHQIYTRRKISGESICAHCLKSRFRFPFFVFRCVSISKTYPDQPNALHCNGCFVQSDEVKWARGVWRPWYFWGVWRQLVPNCIFHNCIFSNCIFPNCIFPNCMMATLFIVLTTRPCKCTYRCLAEILETAEYKLWLFSLDIFLWTVFRPYRLYRYKRHLAGISFI